jgi:hypothetical protein
MKFRLKADPTRSEETIIEVCEDDALIATIRVGDLPRSLLIISKEFSHAVFDCHEQPEKLIAHFRENASGPPR